MPLLSSDLFSIDATLTGEKKRVYTLIGPPYVRLGVAFAYMLHRKSVSFVRNISRVIFPMPRFELRSGGIFYFAARAGSGERRRSEGRSRQDGPKDLW
jgi:hypothetical protein